MEDLHEDVERIFWAQRYVIPLRYFLECEEAYFTDLSWQGKGLVCKNNMGHPQVVTRKVSLSPEN